MNTITWALIGVTALMVLSIPFVLRLVGGTAAKAAASDPAFAGAAVTAPALYGGGEGPQVPVVRGTGALGLVRGPIGDELLFVLAVPRRELHVPLRSVTGASVERALRLRGMYRRTRNAHPWLVVRWVDESGVPSAAGFVVADPARWGEVLNAAGRTRPPASPGPVG